MKGSVRKTLAVAFAVIGLIAAGGMGAEGASAAKQGIEITSTTRLTILGNVVFRWKGRINGPDVCKANRSIFVGGGNGVTNGILARTKSTANGTFTISAPNKLFLVIAVERKRVKGITCAADAVNGKRVSLG